MFRTSIATINHIRFELSDKRPTLVFYVWWDTNNCQFIKYDFTLPSSKQVLFTLMEYSVVDDISKLESKEIRIILKDDKVCALGHLFEDKSFTVEQKEDELIIKTFVEIAYEDH